MINYLNDILEYEVTIFDKEKPCNILMHGFDSSMHSRSVTALFQRLANAKQNVCKFSFRGHGNSAGDLKNTSVSNQVNGY